MTRFFFASGDTAYDHWERAVDRGDESKAGTCGNFIDAVSFGSDPVAPMLGTVNITVEKHTNLTATQMRDVDYQVEVTVAGGNDVNESHVFTAENFTNGVATYTFQNLPVTDDGTNTPRFTVTENASNVPSHDVLSSVSVDNAVVPGATTQTEIAIPKESSKTVSFTNTYTRKDADLTIVKKISDNVIDSVNNEFVFKVEQDKTNLAADQIASGTYGSCTFTDGVAEIAIAGEDSITIPGLPVGTYTVTEVTAGDIDLNNTQEKTFTLKRLNIRLGLEQLQKYLLKSICNRIQR